MRIPILAGRDLLPSDDHRTAVIVSRRVALEMYGTLDVLGRGFPKTDPTQTSVGVVGDAHLIKVTATDVGEQYSPLDPSHYEHFVLVARARSDPVRLLGPMRQLSTAADNRVLARASLMRADFDKRLQPPRLAGSIAALTGLLALSLACLGIYGVVSFGAALRTREIGIRMALGSSRGAILRLLARQQAWPLLLGMIVGLAGAVPVAIGLQREPLYLSPIDPVVQAAVSAVFLITAGGATLLPAWQALRWDPLRALRHD
jgi:hypothetical protein